MNLRTRHTTSGFTLVELMISIALVLILMLAINQVFKIAGASVGSGQALSAVQRDNRSASAVFYDDIKHVAFPRTATSDGVGPAFIIRSDRVYAFRNRVDHLSDLNADANNPTATQIRSRDIDGDNVETAAENTYAAIYNDRSHRIDQLGFFASGIYRRQTGDGDTFVSPMSSSEAYIWYGHLRLPDFGTIAQYQGYQHRDPGEGPYSTNRDNFYASQWAIGRVVMTLRERDALGQIKDDKGNNQIFIKRPVSGDSTYYSSLAPLSANSSDSDQGNFKVQWHRYDLAATSFHEYGDVLRNYTGAAWYDVITTTRYQSNPFPTKPLDGFGIARTAPIFIRACSQFIVEFAGDFVSQDNTSTSANYGNVLSNNPPVPDGTIDYVVVNGGRQTRWYGMPRDTNGDGSILGFAAGRTNNQMPDVVPLQDIVSSGIGTNFEPTAASGYQLERIDRTSNASTKLAWPTNDYVAASGGMNSDSRYYAAWGPGAEKVPKPRMIRITLALDDPNGAISSPQTCEYVIEIQ